LPRKGDSRRSERLELARRLHDGTAQQLISLGYKLDEVIGAPDLSNTNRRLIRQARLDLIALTNDLRDQLYLLERLSIEDAVEEVRELLVDLDIEVSSPMEELDERTENVLAQIILELARNCARHSSASKFWIKQEQVGNSVIFKVGDDGATGLAVNSHSLGLRLVSEQASLIGASIELNSDSNSWEYVIALDSSTI
jgi:signal transduction histidine kinase